jgi:murein L,D-transpeptidase YafK
MTSATVVTSYKANLCAIMSVFQKATYRVYGISFLVVLTMTFSAGGIERVEARSNFKDQQMKYPHVRRAYQEKEELLRGLFQDKKLVYPPAKLFIRVFKKERILEVWAFSERDSVYHLVKAYMFCSLSGSLGPKRMKGDLQVPEGFYHIERFNPASRFYLSLQINYPNESDMLLGEKGNLGGNVFIHGGCVTIGCIPMTDEWIKEIYVLVVEARRNGQDQIPVHVFPMRLTGDYSAQQPGYELLIVKFAIAVMERINSISPVIVFSDSVERLRQKVTPKEELPVFWKNLKEGHDLFEQRRILPLISVDDSGVYRFRK